MKHAIAGMGAPAGRVAAPLQQQAQQAQQEQQQAQTQKGPLSPPGSFGQAAQLQASARLHCWQ